MNPFITEIAGPRSRSLSLITATSLAGILLAFSAPTARESDEDEGQSRFGAEHEQADECADSVISDARRSLDVSVPPRSWRHDDCRDRSDGNGRGEETADAGRLHQHPDRVDRDERLGHDRACAGDGEREEGASYSKGSSTDALHPSRTRTSATLDRLARTAIREEQRGGDEERTGVDQQRATCAAMTARSRPPGGIAAEHGEVEGDAG